MNLPRGKYIGKRAGQLATDEAKHSIRCPACGGWIDCRDLAQVFEHEGPASGTGSAAMTEKKPRYESLERMHKEVLDFKHIEAISEPTRELIGTCGRGWRTSYR